MARSCTAGRCGLPAVVRLASMRGVAVGDERAWNLLATSGHRCVWSAGNATGFWILDEVVPL